MTEGVILGIVAAASTVIGSVMTYFNTKAKYDNENNKIFSHQVDSLSDIIISELQRARDTINDLKKENYNFVNEIDKLQEQIRELRTYCEFYQRDIKELKEKIGEK